MNEREPKPWSQVVSDGYPIAGLAWAPDGLPWAQMMIIHGVQSHADWYHRLGRKLADAGIAAYFPDRRGSGRNERDRGHAPSSKRLVDDITEHLQDVKTRNPTLPLLLAGISWGGKLTVVASVKQPGLVDGLVLLAPGLRPKVDVGRWDRLRIFFAFFLNRRRLFPVPLADPALFTANPKWREYIRNDTRSIRQATAGLLAASSALDLQVRRALPKLYQPTLLLLAGQDRIVNNDLTLKDFALAPGADKTIKEYPEAHHTLEFEPDPDVHIDDVISWVVQRFRPVSAKSSSSQTQPMLMDVGS